jgi:hypothetical protein
VVQLPQFFWACCVSNTQGDWGGAAWLSIPRLLAGMPRLHHSKCDPLMTGPGRVSRGSPVQTAVRNCTRDEGRPFEVGNQVLISSHRKLLLSKAMVVNVAEKSERDFGRYD